VGGLTREGVTTAAPRRPSSGSSFHYSFGLLPPRQRDGLEALYAFCRTVDDIADEDDADRAGALVELDRYREEIDRCYGGSPRLQVTRRLADCIAEFGIPRPPLDAILDGVAMDLHKTRYADFTELREYCYRVASAVGLVCVAIFGCRHPRSRDYAIDLGIALQLTNILRDLRSDARRGRIYVPRDEMEACGYGESDLLAGVRNEPFLRLMRMQAGRAGRHFEQAAAALPEIDRRRLLAAEVMGAIYRRLLRRIEAGRFRVFDRRIRVPRLTQIGLALRARVTGRVGG
jgi:phytoene synthase